nr:MAG TPA: hypothetical protein [Caudoviricetes sp.]
MKIDWFNVLAWILAIFISIICWFLIIKFWMVIPILVLAFIFIFRKEIK